MKSLESRWLSDTMVSALGLARKAERRERAGIGSILTRREFIGGLLAVTSGCRVAPVAEGRVPAVISTREFGRKANAVAWKILAEGGSSLDAVEKGINDAELDPEINSVGWGGLPNEDGETTLDAVIMWGPKHAAGAVGGLRRIRPAISVARKVLEKTKHTFLVGEDATRFALRMGFTEEDVGTQKSKARWEQWKGEGRPDSFWSHDSIGMVAVDARGDVTAGCSTSGLAFKIAGRVGDGPIVGSGAYCDNDVGGVAATGDGDVMMRFCPALVAVELMRAGNPPAEACLGSLRRIGVKGYKVRACLVALARSGEFGAAKIGDRPFAFAIRNADTDEIRTVP